MIGLDPDLPGLLAQVPERLMKVLAGGGTRPATLRLADALGRITEHTADPSSGALAGGHRALDGGGGDPGPRDLLWRPGVRRRTSTYETPRIQ